MMLIEIESTEKIGWVPFYGGHFKPTDP